MVLVRSDVFNYGNKYTLSSQLMGATYNVVDNRRAETRNKRRKRKKEKRKKEKKKKEKKKKEKRKKQCPGVRQVAYPVKGHIEYDPKLHP
jgi:hypothetical protein